MNSRSFYILVILLFLSGGIFSQEPTDTEDDYVLSQESLSFKDKINYQTKVTFGAGISNSGSFLSTSIRPSVAYQVTPKFSFYSGIGFTQYQLDNFRVFTEYGYQTFSGNLAQMTAFVGGKYQLNDRLAVSGEVFYNLAQFSPNMANSSYVSAFDRVGYAASFEYKVGDNMFIEGQIRINDFNRGSNPYNPFRDHGFGSGSFMRQSSGVNTFLDPR